MSSSAMFPFTAFFPPPSPSPPPQLSLLPTPSFLAVLRFLRQVPLEIHLDRAIARGTRIATGQVEHSLRIITVETFERNLPSARPSQLTRPRRAVVQFVAQSAVAPCGHDHGRLLTRRHAVDFGHQAAFPMQVP